MNMEHQIKITVNDQIFICSSNWTVDQARNKIRNAFCLAGGHFLCADGAAMLGTDSIIGAVSFVGGKGVMCYVRTFYPFLINY